LNLSATDGAYTDRVRVTWDAATFATNYVLYRNTTNDSGTATVIVSGVAGTLYDDTSAMTGIVYYYWAKATNVAGASVFSSGDSGYRLVAPSAPLNLSATDGAYTDRVRVTWDAATNATGYVLYRHTANNSGTATAIVSGVAGTLCDDTSATAGIVYYYWVKATNAAGASSFSSGDTGYRLAAPMAPLNLSATDGAYTDRVRVTWDAATFATGYVLYRHTANNSGSATPIGSGLTGTLYDDTTAVQGTTYYYWIKGTNAAGVGAFSLGDSGYAATLVTLNVQASDGSYFDKVRVTWSALPLATGYQVWRHTASTIGSASLLGAVAETGYDDTGATPGLTYYYWVRATNSAGPGTFSASDTGWRNVLYTLTPSAGPGGGISPSSPVTVTYGANQTFQFAPATGFRIRDVTVDGVSVGAVSLYAFTSVHANHTIDAQFVTNQPPTLVLQATPRTGWAPLRVTYDFTGSSDPDGRIVRYEVDRHGDGVYEVQNEGSGVFTVDYTEDGTFNSLARIIDNDGANARTTVVVVVMRTGLAPSLQAVPASGPAPLTVSLIGTNSTAPEGRRIVVYEWDPDGNGVFDRISTTGTISYVYRQAGAYTAVLRVTDDTGLKASATATVTVGTPIEDPPTVRLNANPSSGSKPLAVAFTAAANSAGGIAYYLWDFNGDGVDDLRTTASTTGYGYGQVGRFEARVTAIANSGLMGSDTEWIQVNESSELRTWITTPRSGDIVWGTAVSLMAHAAPGSQVAWVQYQYTPAGQGSWSNLGAALVPPQNAYSMTWDVTSLTDGAAYELRTVAGDTSGGSVTSDVVTIRVDSGAGGQVGGIVEDEVNGQHRTTGTYSQDETAQMELHDGTTVEVPMGTVESTLTLEVILADRNVNPTNGAAAGQVAIHENLTITIEGDPELQRAITIDVPYPDANNDGFVDGTRVRETTLSLFWYNTASSRWERTLSSEVHADENFIRATTYHLTEFGAFGTGQASVSGDYDGDGVSDLAVFDQNTGCWYIRTLPGTLLVWAAPWGWPGAEPVSGDYDGDGISDLAVFDQITGNWYVRTMSGTVLAWAVPWGWPGAEPVGGDYDGDGVSDLAVFDQSTGNWYIRTLDGATLAWAVQWGWPGAEPISGDYDGDDVDDLALFDQNTGYWYIRTMSGSQVAWASQWGWPGAEPTSGDYDGDGISDLAVFDQNSGFWFIRTVSGTMLTWAMNWGWPGATPVGGDFNGGQESDVAVFDQNTGNWYIRTMDGEMLGVAVTWGWPGATPIR
ncbi:MAG: PKD domain-containing protein, partial [Lentisphaerae bacterium]|nr:PKD domain-containing protein [Lentisphaerota bacterium]